MIKYYDKKNKIRRIEKVYNKGYHLKHSNDKIILFLKEIFKKNLLFLRINIMQSLQKAKVFMLIMMASFFLKIKMKN